MATKATIKLSDNVFYEVVGTLLGGAELRRYTFFDRWVLSVIFVDGCIKEAVPIEREDKMVARWEEKEFFEEVERW